MGIEKTAGQKWQVPRPLQPSLKKWEEKPQSNPGSCHYPNNWLDSQKGKDTPILTDIWVWLPCETNQQLLTVHLPRGLERTRQVCEIAQLTGQKSGPVFQFLSPEWWQVAGRKVELAEGLGSRFWSRWEDPMEWEQNIKSVAIFRTPLLLDTQI